MFIDTVGYSKLSMNEQRVAIDHRFQKLVAKAIVPEGEIIDVFSAAGLKQPDISIDSPIAHRLTLSGLPIYVAASQHAPFSPISS